MRVLFFIILIVNSLSAHTVRILGETDKRGIAKDIIVLKEAVTLLGHKVELNPKSKVDIQIHIQKIEEDLIPLAKKNYLIPNPEWTDSIEKVDLILARTREAERIFKEKEVPVFYLGFTSVDQLLTTKKDFQSYIHIKGFSPYKSTTEIIRSWKKYFPKLLLIDHRPDFKKLPDNIQHIEEYIPDDDIKWLQNRAGIHLCPSNTEGFGHYLSEAMSAGSVVITTDAPPMNEFITDPRFLLRPESITKSRFATLYHVSPKAISDKIIQLIKMDPKVLREVGVRNREKFLEMRAEFFHNMEMLLKL